MLPHPSVSARIISIAIALFISNSLSGQSLINLAAVGWQRTDAMSLNNSGQVVGSIFNGDTGSAVHHPFLYRNGAIEDLSAWNLSIGTVNGINDSGQFTGEKSNAVWPNQNNPYLYTNGVMTDLGTLGGAGGVGSAVSNNGKVTGMSYTREGKQHGFVYHNGSMTDIGTLGGNFSMGFSINDAGQVVGQSSLDDSGFNIHGFIYSNGVMTDLGTFGSTISGAYDINEAGEVTGFSVTADAKSRTILYKNGVTYDLGSLGGDSSVGQSINNFGVIVGQSSLAGTDSLFEDLHAFIYSDGSMRDLNTLYSGIMSDGLSIGFTQLNYATSINDYGMITGIGTYFDGATYSRTAYLLDTRTSASVPDAFPTLVLFGLSVVNIAFARRLFWR